MREKKLSRKAIKDLITKLFNKKVKGKQAKTLLKNANHDGKDGYWLETQMGVASNGNNAPDLMGFEMKTGTKSKTTFGDWSASFYIFKCSKNPHSIYTRSDFLKMFGKPNADKKGRHSWSGDPCPKVKNYNKFGQKLIVNRDHSISAIYNYSYDKRANKKKIIPLSLRSGDILLAKWDCEWMRKKVESKFNRHGWFKCLRDSNGRYIKIVFGPPFDYETWISLVKKGKIYFDSGMYEGNSRNYSHWRADNKLWDSLLPK